MAKNVKTPVMVLMELTVKRNYPPPEFDLIYSKSNTHDNEYTFQVTIQNVSAIGSGKSKKEAKQNTALKALELLNEKGIYHPDFSTISNPKQRAKELPSPKKPSVNCIMTLSELCFENKLPEPEYREISDIGPPHCREFTYSCTVGSIVTTATAGTKKQAKQLAAQEMLEKVNDILLEISSQFQNQLITLNYKDHEVINKYQEITNVEVKPNLSIPVSKYCDQLLKLVRQKEKNTENLLHYFSLENKKEALEGFLNELELKYEIKILQERIDSKPYIVGIELNMDTPFATMVCAPSVEKATEKAISEILEMIKIHLEIN